MKYYLPRPIYGYLLLSIIGAGVFGGMVIGLYSIADIDLPDDKRMYTLLIGFCLFALFFVARAIYKKHRRDYVELAEGYIEWVTHNGKTAKINRINTNNIRLFEIVYFEREKQPSFYWIYGAAEEEMGALELYSIPYENLLQYCRKSNISPLVSTIKYTEIENVKANAKRIKIEYFAKFPCIWGRSKRIPFSEIADIDFVSTHRISKTEDHYIISTRQGKVYKFSSKPIDNEKMLIQGAAAHGINVVPRYTER